LIWRNASTPNPAKKDPCNNGWIEDSGFLKIQWYCDNFIPEELEDVLADKSDNVDNVEEEYDTDSDES